MRSRSSWRSRSGGLGRGRVGLQRHRRRGLVGDLDEHGAVGGEKNCQVSGSTATPGLPASFREMVEHVGGRGDVQQVVVDGDRRRSAEPAGDGGVGSTVRRARSVDGSTPAARGVGHGDPPGEARAVAPTLARTGVQPEALSATRPVHQALLPRQQRRLHPVLDAQHAEQHRHPVADGLLRDPELGGDARVRPAVGDEGEQAQVGRAQPVQRGGEPGRPGRGAARRARDLRAQHQPAVEHRAGGADDRVRRRVLEQVAARAGGETGAGRRPRRAVIVSTRTGQPGARRRRRTSSTPSPSGRPRSTTATSTRSVAPDRRALAHRPGLDDPAHPVLEARASPRGRDGRRVVVDDQDRRGGRGHGPRQSVGRRSPCPRRYGA